MKLPNEQGLFSQTQHQMVIAHHSRLLTFTTLYGGAGVLVQYEGPK